MNEFELNLLFCMFLPLINKMNLALNLLNLVKPLLNFVKFHWIVKSLFYLKIHCCLSFEWATFHSSITGAHSAFGRMNGKPEDRYGNRMSEMRWTNKERNGCISNEIKVFQFRESLWPREAKSKLQPKLPESIQLQTAGLQLHFQLACRHSFQFQVT